MAPFFRALRFFPVFLVASGIPLGAQDMPLRVGAVRLMERANAVIRPGHLMPSRKHEVTFPAYGLDGTVKDGTHTGIYSGDGERYEEVFGNDHAIRLHLPDRIIQSD